MAGSKLVVMGGEVIPRTPIDSTVHMLDLAGTAGAKQEWQSFPPGGVSPTPRVAHAQDIVGDMLYIFGGRQGITMDEMPLNDLWRFDITKGAWDSEVVTEEGLPPSPRSFHKMVTVGTHLYIFGGCGVDGRLADLHRFDTTTAQWEALPAPPESLGLVGRGGAGFCKSVDNRSLFVVGGFIGQESNIICRFDIESLTWHQVLAEGNGVLRPLSVSCSATLHGPGLIVFFGGEVDESIKGHEGAGSFSNEILVLDGNTGMPVTSGAAAKGMTPPRRGWADAHNLGDDNLVLYGGLSGDDDTPTRLGDVWILSHTSTQTCFV